MADGSITAVGRRKTSIATARLVPSAESPKITINGRSVDNFFAGIHKHAMVALQSFNAVQGFGGYDVRVDVQGGGITGQAEAVRHAIARVLSAWNPKVKLQMRKEGFLTRDPRAVERKKSGQPGARKRYQYSKR